MKRSEINSLMSSAVAFMDKMNFKLPAFAYWGPDDWKSKGPEYNEIRDNMLGWDITDFGSGDFYNTGLLLFTLRNGNLFSDKYKKPYAEKIMVVGENQVTPYHFHPKKMEDIINRGGGSLIIKLYNSAADKSLSDTPVTICSDGRQYSAPAGTEIRLIPGSGVTIIPGQYHKFWGEKGSGPVLAGEVSKVNDDRVDNSFLKNEGRFPSVDEDAVPLYLLCSEYPAAVL